MRGAARSASTDSKSGTSDNGSLVSSRTRSTSSADVVPETITVPSACSPCRLRAAARSRRRARGCAARGRRGRARARGCRAGRDAARRSRRAGAARRAARRRSACRGARAGCGRAARDPPSSRSTESYASASRRRHMNESFRRYGSSRFWSPISAAYSGSSRSSRAIDSTSSASTSTRRDETPIAAASARTSSRYRMRSSVRARSSASATVSAPAFGLPSASPPIQVPKRSGGGASGRCVR